MTARAPAPPSTLGRDGAALWRKIVAEYDASPAELALVERLCAAHDRARAAEREIKLDGVTVDGRFGPRAHPAIAIARDAAAIMVRVARALGLELDDGAPLERGRLGAKPGPRPGRRRR